MFLHQQVHLLQWNSHVCGFLCTAAKQLSYLCSERSNPRRQCSETCCCAVIIHWVSHYYTSACFVIYLLPLLRQVLLMWFPASERWRAQTLSCTASDTNIKNCGRESLNDFSRHFSTKSESSFGCNRSGIHMKRYQRTCCNAYTSPQTKSSIF